MSSHVAASRPVLPRATRWPSRGAVCSQQWGGARLCETCLERFASPRPRCVRCATALPSALPRCADGHASRRPSTRRWRATARRVSTWRSVPLAPRRLAERGNNQGGELARRVARHLGVRADAWLLRHLVDTPHVADLPRGARATAVRGAFALEPRRAAAVRGQRIALVDGVMTTGATLGEAARVLRHAGAAEVHAWLLARTPAPHDD